MAENQNTVPETQEGFSNPPTSTEAHLPDETSSANVDSKKAAATAKYPRHAVEKSLRIPAAIYAQNAGNPALPKEAVSYVGGTSVTGAMGLEISSAKKWGFLVSQKGKLALTDRARMVLAPQSEGDKVRGLREAVLSAPEISDVYSFYRGENLPDEKFLINALTDRFHIPADKVGDFLQVFDESLRAAELIDESGPRPKIIDAGREESAKADSRLPAPVKNLSKAGATCFVVQPFAGALGSYYDLIFKPAIEQAGLASLRADAEIFGTGKIIDQIYRGISGASVLVAELTTKNPNVFYELGLAHALRKPVVLVSSNQEDVPFDLRHIRVVLYDQSDPFWGEKLINKVADNIKSAITNPEEAIFPLEATDD